MRGRVVGDEFRVAGVDHGTRTANLLGADDCSVCWEPNRLAARSGGVAVYRSETMELRGGDRIRWTRIDTGLGLVNSASAEVAAVRDGKFTFRLEKPAMPSIAWLAQDTDVSSEVLSRYAVGGPRRFEYRRLAVLHLGLLKHVRHQPECS